MGRLTFSIADYDGEVSVVTLPWSDLTAVNIDAEYADAITMQTALDGVSRGKILKREQTAKTSPQAVGAATDAEAQREEKALVKYYDATTFQRATCEIPAVDMTTQLAGHPGYFYLENQSGSEEAEWTAFVAAFEASVPGPGGNAAVVEAVLHVGRNI